MFQQIHHITGTNRGQIQIFIDKPISFEEYYKQKLSTEEYERLSQDVMEVIKDNYYKR